MSTPNPFAGAGMSAAASAPPEASSDATTSNPFSGAGMSAAPPGTSAPLQSGPQMPEGGIGELAQGIGQTGLSALSHMAAPVAAGLAGIGTLIGTRSLPDAADAVQNTQKDLTYNPTNPVAKALTALPSQMIARAVHIGQTGNLVPSDVQKFAQRWMGRHFGQEFTHDVASTVAKYGPMASRIMSEAMPGLNPFDTAPEQVLAGGLSQLQGGLHRLHQEAGRLAEEGHPLEALAVGQGPHMAFDAAQGLGLMAGAGELGRAASEALADAAPEAAAAAPAAVGAAAPEPPPPEAIQTPAPTVGRAVARAPVPPAPAAPAPVAAPAPSGDAGALLRQWEHETTENPDDPATRLVHGNTAMHVVRDPFEPDVAHVQSIEAQTKGQGQGSAAMHHLTTLADQHGVTLSLTPRAFGNAAGAVPQDQLERFYRSFGFHPDPNPPEEGAMLRAPMGPSVNRPGLAGMPSLVDVGGKPVMFGPNPMVRTAAANYAEAAGIPYHPPTTYEPITPTRGALIAKAFDEMEHNPDDPATKASYDALIRETKAQYDAIRRTGLKVEFVKPGQPDPYTVPPDTMSFRHFSGVRGAPENILLDPEQQGTGIPGAEARRLANNGGPRTVAAYAADHPDTAVERPLRGRTEYRITVPRDRMYNLSEDPEGVRQSATQDGVYNHSTAEQLIKDRGYLGYHVPDGAGIMRGQARFLQPVEGVRADVAPPVPRGVSNPRLALLDIANRNHLWVQPTSEGYGNPLLNIGLKVGDTGAVAPQDAINAIERTGAKVVHAGVHMSSTEPSLVASLNRALTPEEAHSLSTELGQEAIVQHAGGKGALYGPATEKWGPFNPDYFITPGGKTLSEVAPHPMLADSGVTLDGKNLTNNDLFRIVHDYFGHAGEGNGFRADGEFNAYRIHRALYSAEAQPALATETLGQNAWVNHGPYGEFNRTAGQGETIYADQKAGLLPPAAIKAADIPASTWAEHMATPLNGAREAPAQVRSRFALPSEEGAVTTSVPPEEIIRNGQFLRQTLPELDEVHKGALTRNYSDAGNIFQTSQFRTPVGDRAREVLEKGQNAMRDAVKGMAPNADASAAGSEARGAVVQDALDSAHNMLAKLDDKYYGAGNAQAAGKRAITKPLTDFLAKNKAEFFKSVEGKQLWNGLTMRMQELGLLGNTDAFNPADATQLEDLRKFMTGPASPNVKHLIGGTKNAIDDAMAASAGPDAYKLAHENRAIRGALFERNDAVSPMLESPDGVEANRKVPASQVMNRIFGQGTSPDDVKAILNTLRATRTHLLNNGESALAQELDGKISDAFDALRQENAARLSAKGQSIERGWNQKAFATELRAQERKMAQIWPEKDLQRWQDLNEAGNLLKLDRTYKGAFAQQVNATSALRRRAANVLEGAITGFAGPLGGAAAELTGLPEKARGWLAGDPVKQALAALEREQIVPMSTFDPVQDAETAGRRGSIPVPGDDGKVSDFEHVKKGKK